MTTLQPQDVGPTLLVPLGATEQHGAHLPVTTDTDIASAVVAGVVASAGPGDAGGPDGGLRAMPALPYGASGEHEALGRTVSIGTEALTLLLLEYGRSACGWAGRVVFVNGHGGNVQALRTACSRLRFEGRDVAWVPCVSSNDPRDTHAGRAETSVMLHLCPEAVEMAAAAPGCVRPLPEIIAEMRSGGVAAVSPSGVLGDPTDATEDEGRRIVAAMISDVGRRIARWAPGEHGVLTGD